MIHPSTPNSEEKTKTGRFPNLVAKADTNGLTYELGQMGNLTQWLPQPKDNIQKFERQR